MKLNKDLIPFEFLKAHEKVVLRGSLFVFACDDLAWIDLYPGLVDAALQ